MRLCSDAAPAAANPQLGTTTRPDQSVPFAETGRPTRRLDADLTVLGRCALVLGVQLTNQGVND